MISNPNIKKALSILSVTVIIFSYILSSGVLLFSPKEVRAATTYTVTKVADTNDGTCDADCSLREAITAANANAGADIIEFNITPADGTAYTITPLSELPTITEQLKIDGTTQSGSSCSARTLKIEIDATNETYGLQTTASNFELYGIAITGAGGQHGLRVLNTSNPTVNCSNFGTDVTGTVADGNNQDGIALENVTGGTIGSTTLANRNIIGANGQAGIELVNGTSGVNVIGNYIGTNFTGTAAIGNTYGVAVWGATGNTVGGTAAGERNIISGNTSIGVDIDNDNDPDPSTNNSVVGNYIGTQPNGTTALANTNHGVSLQGGATGNNIGGTTGVTLDGACTGSCNVISGNGADGVYLNGANVTTNIVQGNYVGTDVNGTADLGNSVVGIQLNTSSSNTIGGTTTGARNIISGNGGSGIIINASNSNSIAGNYIGTDTTGSLDIGNDIDGIYLEAGSANNTIGGTTTAARNIISGNTQNGISSNGQGSPAGTGNVIQGNYIGLAADGLADLGNTQSGIGLFDIDGTTIGGTATGARNVVSGNTENGIQIQIVSSVSINNNQVLGNYVGSDYTGNVGLGNDKYGIAITAGTGTENIIGGTTSGARNVVVDNAQYGIGVNGAVTVQGNYVGIKADGSAPLGNGTSSANFGGIAINGSGAVVGGNSLTARNYVAGALGGGISVSGTTPFGGSQTNNVTIQGNCIGTNTSCGVESGYGNAQYGINTFTDVDNVLIGGTGAGEGNVIAGNGAGIVNLGFQTYTPVNVSIVGNSIYNNSGGTTTQVGIDNLQTNNFVNYINLGVTLNDADDIDYNGNNIGTNHYLNFPEISSVTSTNGTATITYNLDINDTETGATGYRVEFFANDTADASGYGQGQTYLGSDTVSGDVTGRQVTITLPAGVDGSKYISATTTMTDNSTDGFGHTSEFGANVQATLVPATPNPVSSALASTGQNIKWIGLVAAILLAGGGAGLYIARRKKLV